MKLSKNSIQNLVLLLPALSLMTVFIVIPFFMSFYFSFTNERLLSRPTGSQWIGMLNYKRLFEDEDFWQAVRNTFFFAIIVTPFQLSISLGSALLLNSKMKGKVFLRSVALLPLLTPMTVIVAIWAVLFKIPDGPLNSAYQFIFNTVEYINWLGDKDVAMFSIILLSAWASFPFQMLIYLAGLQDIPKEIYEAAEVDGAKTWNKFLYITMPSLRNTNIFVIIITTIAALKLFTQVNILTHGGPNGSTNTVVHYMYENGFLAQKIGYASAVSVLFFLVVSIIVLLQRYLLKNE